MRLSFISLKKNISFLRPIQCSLLLCTLTTALHASDTLNNPKKEITLAATDWCPYTCDDSAKPGYIVDIMQQVFSRHGFSLTVRFFPWNRAIAKVKRGQVDGLLTAVPSEAPELKFTTTPSDYYQMCFYTTQENYWSYYGDSNDLKTINLGILSGYGYGEPLDSYVADPKNAEKIEKIAGAEPLSAMTRMLKLKRISALIEDKYVLKNFYYNHPQADNIETLREAGCLDAHPFFLAFSPNLKSVNTLISDLNHFFQSKDYEVLKFNTLNEYKLVKESGLGRDNPLKNETLIVTH